MESPAARRRNTKSVLTQESYYYAYVIRQHIIKDDPSIKDGSELNAVALGFLMKTNNNVDDAIQYYDTHKEEFAESYKNVSQNFAFVRAQSSNKEMFTYD